MCWTHLQDACITNGNTYPDNRFRPSIETCLHISYTIPITVKHKQQKQEQQQQQQHDEERQHKQNNKYNQ